VDIMGRYRLGEPIGAGATARVFEVVDTVLEREAAIKVFRSVECDDDQGDDQAARFEEEVRLLSSLVHPHLVPLYDAGIEDEHRFIVMPLVRGTTLAKSIADEGPLPPRDAKAIGTAMADALAYVHARGIVHRDVKPSNILLAEDGTPYLADFGFAHSEESPALTATNCVVGTAGYLSPEQAEGRSAQPASDVYALGLVLLEALTGRAAYSGTLIERATANALRPPSIPAGFGPEWFATLTAMTARDPADRPTAAAAGELLSRVEEEPPEVTAFADTMELPAVRAEIPVAPPRRRVASLGAAALLAAAVVGLGVESQWLAFGTPGTGGARQNTVSGTEDAGTGAGSSPPAPAPATPLTPPSSGPATTPTTAPSTTPSTPSTSTTTQQPATQLIPRSCQPAAPGTGKGHGKHKCQTDGGQNNSG
jgi:eukaryotic-like serine/threonine-protein kinase